MKSIDKRFEENKKAAKKGVALILFIWFIVLCIACAIVAGFLYLIKIWFFTTGC